MFGLGTWGLGFGACVLAAVAGCGKKGPPLAPLVHIPAAVDKIAADRAGSDVYVTLTVPSENIDHSKPADVARVDVYAVTSATPPPAGQFLAQATRVAEVPVAPAAAPDRPAPRPLPAGSAAVQGMAITVHERLTPEQRTPVTPLPPTRPTSRAGGPAPPATSASAGAAGPPMPHRFYMAIAFSDRARSAPQGAVADLPLALEPPPPTDLQFAYTADTLTLSWEPSGGLLGFLLDRAQPIEPAPVDDVTPTSPSGPLASDVPAGPTRYNIYRDEAEDPLTLPTARTPAGWNTPRPQPLNPAPVDALRFSEPADFVRTQCYSVRAVRGAAGALVEGDPTPRECVTAVDTFPPAPPANLTAVATAGAISLVWEPNAELDLGGYLVLRGETGSATLQPLTDRPITEAKYTDRTVMAGRRYVYSVVAVDDRVPVPNMSAESARVEETAP